MRTLKELQDKIKDIEKLRKNAEKPLHDAIESVAKAKDAHVHDVERICYAPERAKTFEQLVHRTAGHTAQDKQLGKDKDALFAAATNSDREFLLTEEKRLQTAKEEKANEYSKHNRDYSVLRGMERAKGLLRPEHYELLALEMKKIASPEVSSWL